MPRKEKIRVPQTFVELFDHVRNDFAGTQKFMDTRMPDNTKIAGKSMQKMPARMSGKKKKNKLLQSINIRHGGTETQSCYCVNSITIFILYNLRACAAKHFNKLLKYDLRQINPSKYPGYNIIYSLRIIQLQPDCVFRTYAGTASA